MTELLYTTDAYVQTFEATVTAHFADEKLGGGVVLDRTAFYPGGGGQPCDFGALMANGLSYEVTRVKKMGGDLSLIHI